MHSFKLLAAAAAFAGCAFAKTCDDVDVKEANPTLDCDTVSGDVTIDESVAGDLILSGIKQIKGDLIIKNVTGLLSVSSTTINSIGGTFELNDLGSLNAITMTALREVKELQLQKLTALRSISFGQEELEATSVMIQDTWVSDLSGLMLTTVETLEIDNCPRLATFDSALVNVTERLYIHDNGKNMAVTMDQLETASEIQIRNVKSFSVDALETVDASLKFDSNTMTSFKAGNLTKVKESLAFINNNNLANISLPKLVSVGADLRIVNNSKYTDIDGFPKLQTMASMNVGGSFESIDLPSLDTVSGATEAATKSKNDTFCNWFNDNSDKFKVTPDCTYDNENADNGGDSDGGSTSSGSNDSSSSDDSDAAGMVSVNTALLGLGLMAGIAQLL